MTMEYALEIGTVAFIIIVFFCIVHFISEWWLSSEKNLNHSSDCLVDDDVEL